MKWTKPEFKEIPLGMEMTSYVNTDKSNTAMPKSAPSSLSAEQHSKPRDPRAS